MAVVTVPYQPGLTAEAAMEIFRRGFWGKYQVYKTHFFTKRDFIVKKSRLVGVGVKLQRKPRETSFVFIHMAPSPFLEWLGGGMWFVGLWLRPEWKRMEAEVRSFIESAPEFGGTRPAVGVARPLTLDGLQPAFCTSCGAPLADNALFCHVCGTPAPVPEPKRRPSCSACGAALGENARFCQKCGAPVPIPEPEPLPSASPPLQEGNHCTRCGTLVAESSLFCHKCGAGVVSVEGDNAAASATGNTLVTAAAIRAGHCERCGQELGVNEKLRSLTAHEVCPMPVAEAPAAAPVQASQVYCSECGTLLPASSRFCHKCGSAVAAAAD